MSWTDQDVRRLRDLAREHSASEIARTLGKTRNAILGKAHRLGITLRPYDPRPSKKRQPMPKLKVVKVVTEAKAITNEKLEAGPPLNISVLDITDRQCRYPVAEPSPKEHCCCGQPVKPGSRYCPVHSALCYTTSTWPKEKASGLSRGQFKETM